jgi:hypothetical protein
MQPELLLCMCVGEGFGRVRTEEGFAAKEQRCV